MGRPKISLEQRKVNLAKHSKKVCDDSLSARQLHLQSLMDDGHENIKRCECGKLFDENIYAVKLVKNLSRAKKTRCVKCPMRPHVEPSPGHMNRIKTHCIRGHEFSKENTTRSNGRRYCRPCKRLKYYEKKEKALEEGLCPS